MLRIAQINRWDVSITVLFIQELVSGEANKMDRGVNTNLHPLFVSAERRRKKHRNLIVFGAAGAGAARRPASVIRRCGRLTRLSVVWNETLFFPFPCFPTSRLLHVFFWIGNGIRQTKNWQKYGRPRWKIVVCDRIFRIPVSLYRKFYLQDRFLVCHFYDADCIIFGGRKPWCHPKYRKMVAFVFVRREFEIEEDKNRFCKFGDSFVKNVFLYFQFYMHCHCTYQGCTNT